VSDLTKTTLSQSVARPRNDPLMPFSLRASDSTQSRKCAFTVFGIESGWLVTELPDLCFAHDHTNLARKTEFT